MIANPSAQEPFVLLDAPVPEEVVAGNGAILSVTGCLISPAHRIHRASVLLDLVPVPTTFRLKRDDAVKRHAGRVEEPESLRHTGFKATLTLRPQDLPQVGLHQLILRATTADGRTTEFSLGEFRLVSSQRVRLESAPTFPSTGPRVVLCMATWNPPQQLFARQIESIRSQTHTNWICLITDDGSSPEAVDRIQAVLGDDPRFVLVRNEKRLGFYRNFERCLSLVPAEADFVALADQDDSWYADKLESLLSAFQDSTTLVYSDMRIVDETGAVMAPTFWTQRPNRWDNLASLLIANTVTGAASMFRAELLDRILPLPYSAGPNSERQFHDHWIACVALAQGDLGYVDRPLYDYVQHRSNVIGHVNMQGVPGSGAPVRRSFVTRLWNKLRAPLPWLQWAHGHHTACMGAAELIEHLASCLSLRCGPLADRCKQRHVEWLCRIGRSRLAQVYLMLRGVQNFWTTTETAQRDLHVGIALTTYQFVRIAASAARAYRRWRGHSSPMAAFEPTKAGAS